MQPGTDRVTLGRAAFAVALFLVALAASQLGLEPLSRREPDELAGVKLRQFEQGQERFSAAFFGSSRVYRGFIPNLFDKVLAENGIELSTYNFGVWGFQAIEVGDLLERVAELEPANLRYVFVDPEELGVVTDDRNVLSRRVIRWHDGPTTALLLRHIRDSELPALERWTLAGSHALSFAYHALHVGSALEWVDPLLGRGVSASDLGIWIGGRSDGFIPRAGREKHLFGLRNERFLQRLGEYWEEVETLRSAPPVDGPPGELELAVYERISAAIERMGATPVFVILPSLNPQAELVRAQREGRVEHLLRYNDPDRYPALYDPAHLSDKNHANLEGARLFTEQLARDFVLLHRRLERDDP